MRSLNEDPGRLLLLGIGNSGRGDDGLGWKFVEIVEQLEFPLVNCEYRYQLQVEDASLVADYDMVIFVDASLAPLLNGFSMECCRAAQNYTFSTHAQCPEAILYLASNLYNKYPKAYTLAIMGIEWELKVGLSSQAEINLQKAISFFERSFLPAIQPNIINRELPVEAEDME